MSCHKTQHNRKLKPTTTMRSTANSMVGHRNEKQMVSLAIFLILFGLLSSPAVAFSVASLPTQRNQQLRTVSRKNARWQLQHKHLSGQDHRVVPLSESTKDNSINGVATSRTNPSMLFLHRTNDSDSLSHTSRWKTLWSNWTGRLSRALKGWRRKAMVLFFCLTVALTTLSGPAWSVTGGRSGGSFKSRPSQSRVYSPPRTRSYHRPPSRVYMRPPPTRLYYRNPVPAPIIVGSDFSPYGPQYRRGISVSDMVLVTGAGLAIAYGVSSHLEKEREQSSSVLGPGFSVAKLTVSLNVPDRDAPNSIIRKLQQLSAAAQTNTRKGVQDLVSNVALELLRQEKAIRSAESRSAHYKLEGDAERDFLRNSIQQRSKFDAETEYKFGDDSRQSAQKTQRQQDSKATEAVVTISVAIEGDSTQLPVIKSRASVLEALQRLAADSQVDDCLLSGEISWAPELRSESLSLEDIYADYPTLYPV